MKKYLTIGEAAQRLIDLVLARGAIDNVTIVVTLAEPTV